MLFKFSSQCFPRGLKERIRHLHLTALKHRDVLTKAQDYQFMGHRFDSPLLWSFGWAFKPRFCLHMTYVVVVRLKLVHSIAYSWFEYVHFFSNVNEHKMSLEMTMIELKAGRVAQSVGHLTRKSEVLGSIPGLATNFRFSFRWFKRGSCQLLAKVCGRSTG